MATSHDQEAYEEHNVHEVYQQIAGHFSLTRHKVRLGSYYYTTIMGTSQVPTNTHPPPAMARRGTISSEFIAWFCWTRCGMRQWQILACK